MKKLIYLILSIFLFQPLTAQEKAEVIPNFSIFSEDGSVFTDKDLVKDKNLVFIYFNPSCGHCKTAFKTLNTNYQNMIIEDVYIYPVSAGTVAETKAFFKDLAPNLISLENIEIIYDEDYRFADAFFVGGFPQTFLYNQDRKLIDSYPGEAKVLDPFEELRTKNK